MSDIINFSGYSHRFLARLVTEAKTPLSVGSGEKNILTDALVATDVNGLPYIPGTAIAGIVRHMIGEESAKSFFGFQGGSNEGHGSEIIFTEARILNSKGEVVDGMNLDAIKYYDELPIRQHVRINEKGVTDKAGKFDEQVVFAGTRFCFELEMVAKDEDITNFNLALDQIKNSIFRIGSGTRCGFGEIQVVDLQKRRLDLKKQSELELYLNKSSELSMDWSGWEKHDVDSKGAEDWVKYELRLTPENFFLFGSGFGDDEVDMTPVKEKKVVWKDGKGELTEELVLIPATSVKGALAHRVAFYYNKLNDRFVGCTGTKEPKVGNDNEAVQALFGYENQSERKQVRGNLLFSDVIECKLNDKILNHVAIDRFTGGAIDGALFSEKTTYGEGHNFTFTILAKNDALKEEEVMLALENALTDICKGMLPLGGGVNRGNGVFNGSLTKDGVVIYE
ncbi:MAG: CRISPR-associated protein [Paludibacteraceae bacterium]|nr:CRISPR-associated protein [Paludibacteraceae bacterium]